jgi:hypothetical protein
MPTEDAWTQPSAWCSRPDWWHSDTDDATEHEVTALVAALVGALQPEVVVETGTNTGQTAFAIGAALRGNGHGHLWTLEVDEELAAGARALVRHLPVTVVTGDSMNWTPPASIDFAWIDTGPVAGATQEQKDASPPHIRAQEIAGWLPQFSRGAVIGVHDTAPHHPVMSTLLPLLRTSGMSFINLRTPRGVVLAQVP